MLVFENDYSEGAHEKVLQRLVETNMKQLSGYGMDPYCESAKKKICEACGCPDAEVYLLTGGTQTNQVVISTMLQPYEGVVAAETGHVSSHEAGAIEYSGHKVLTLPQHEGKIQPKDLADYLNDFYSDGNHEHMVFPGMVYISHPTEYGTLYTKQELADISSVCREYEIPLFLDGARLGYGLGSVKNDLTLEKMAELTDVFYIGGTKCGALFGEALVITNKKLARKFRTYMKQNGAVLAKGWLLGLQFYTLLENDLYFEITRKADMLAMKIRDAFAKKGIPFWVESPTNQQFVILSPQQQDILGKNYTFEKTGNTPDGIVARFCTSWATTEEEVAQLIADIEKL